LGREAGRREPHLIERKRRLDCVSLCAVKVNVVLGRINFRIIKVYGWFMCCRCVHLMVQCAVVVLIGWHYFLNGPSAAEACYSVITKCDKCMHHKSVSHYLLASIQCYIMICCFFDNYRIT